ncbi:hypothetical protein E6C50_13455 [Flavobacterium supellecticarium]|uniref:Uncharacterized protein n=1 Tax=Flavobacterium supellecticarium TaxID=2565924 RepID=A0A4V3W7U8_9FLAO|nr:hypothetical protein [Flavobacterium supellecticarium]THF48755.1 hypothetical protein E6C50_13455 [Flavobacterium supellecticarium]
MQRLFFSIALLTSLLSSAQTTIINEKIEKDNTPMGFEVLSKQNKLLLKKGKAYGTIRGINKVELYSFDNPKPTELVKDEKFLRFIPSPFDDNIYSGDGFNTVGWQTDTKIYDGNKVIATVDGDKRLFLFSKDFSYGLGNEKNKIVDNIEKHDLFWHKYDNKLKKTEVIKLQKPSFFNNVNKKDYYDLDDLAYRAYYNKNSFEIATKYINKDIKSFVLHRAIFDLNGKNIKTITYNVNIEKPLIFSNNGGGKMDVSAHVSSNALKFVDQLSINNYHLDEDTNELYIYGLYGKKDKRLYNTDVGGYYVVKFDAEGKLLWQKTEEFSDDDLTHDASKTRINLGFSIVNKQGHLSFYQHFSRKFYYYSQIDLASGNRINSAKVPFSVDKMWQIELSHTPVLAFFTLKEYKKLKFDFTTLYFNGSNKKVQDYLIELNKSSKKEISVNSEASEKGVWLIESDNNDYYKVTFFEF